MPDRTSTVASAMTPRTGRGWASCAIEAQTSIGVLDADHGVIDELADRDRQTAEGHRVDRQADGPENQDRHEDRDRDRRQRDDRRAEIEEEGKKDDRDHRRRLEQYVLQGGDRVLDEFFLLEDDLSAWMPFGRKAAPPAAPSRCRLVKSSVLTPGCFWTRNRTAGLPMYPASPCLTCGSKPTVRHLAAAEWAAVLVGHHEMARALEQLVGFARAADIQDQEAAAVLVDRVAAGVGVVAGDGLLDLVDGDIERNRGAGGPGVTRNWRTSPPIGRTCETPGIACSRGRMNQSAVSRNAIMSPVSEVMAMISISPMTDEIGLILGVTLSGSCSRACDSRSATSWRSR